MAVINCKTCSFCNEVKPFSEFHVRRASGDGLCTRCKQCCKSSYINKNNKKTKSEIPIENEIWKDISEYEGYYQVSNFGGIKTFISNSRYSVGDKMKTANGKYKSVTLCKNGSHCVRNIHRLVAESFIPNPENKSQVNHKNGIKHDNRVENLEWITQKDNILHAFKNGLMSTAKGELSGNAKLYPADIVDIRNKHANGIKIIEIADCYSVYVNTIKAIVIRKTWKHI